MGLMCPVPGKQKAPSLAMVHVRAVNLWARGMYGGGGYVDGRLQTKYEFCGEEGKGFLRVGLLRFFGGEGFS
jgi:hypothetical protein